jgi:hypothetical protein
MSDSEIAACNFFSNFFLLVEEDKSAKNFDFSAKNSPSFSVASLVMKHLGFLLNQSCNTCDLIKSGLNLFYHLNLMLRTIQKMLEFGTDNSFLKVHEVIHEIPKVA